MPQLPSGRHIALDPSPLQQVIEDAYEGLAAHELMAIDRLEKLFAYIDVLYFRPGQLDTDLQLANFSIVPPDGLEPYASGFNVVSIQREVESWREEDKKAFVRFLNSQRVNEFLVSLMEAVNERKSQLTDNPQTLQGMLALWWKLGIHPLQQDERNDG